MNYAEKELREAMTYLEQARNNFDSLRSIQRALELGQPVEVSFRTAQHSVTALCPGKGSEKLVCKLLDQASERLTELEKQEVYWVRELAAVHRQQEINAALRANPDASLYSLKQRERADEMEMWAANDSYMAQQHGKGQVAGPPKGSSPDGVTVAPLETDESAEVVSSKP